MLRLAMLLVSPVFISCASLTTNDLIAGETSGLRPAGALGAEHGTAPATVAPEIDASALPSTGTEPSPFDSSMEPAIPAEPPPSLPGTLVADEGESLHNSRFTIKGGYFSAEDADALDDGWIVNVSWMRFFTKLLALELEVGYLDASGEDGGVDGDLWGAPIMVNGRANLPVWILDVYGGLGVGGIYYDAEAGALEDDGFLLGGNAFLGATMNLADAIALGLEAKYYLTEESDEFDEALDAYALMLTLGFSR